MSEAKAYSPASLSLIFKACLPAKHSLAMRAGPNKDPFKMGSIGVGCTIDRGVTVSVRDSTKTQVLFNGKSIKFPTVDSVIKALSPKTVIISIKSSLPLGFGFGLSGASALAAAYALNKLSGFKKGRQDLAKIAHQAEITNSTGLGSVGTQITGGFLVKNSPGIPVSNAVSLPFIGKKMFVTIIDRLPTPTILKNKKLLPKINKAADNALKQIGKGKHLGLGEIIDIAFYFALNSTVLSDPLIISIISNIKKSGGHATMAMLGQVVISDIKPKLGKNFRIEELTITNDIAALL